MKFNWGTGIFLFYTFFAATLFFQVYQSTQYDNHLVVENYYEEDLNYQKQYEKVANSLRLEEKVAINFLRNSNVIQVQFPKNLTEVKGDILFYRASDKGMDKKFPLVLNDNNQMQLKAHEFTTGYWTIEVDWQSNGQPFFDSKTLHLKTEN